MCVKTAVNIYVSTVNSVIAIALALGLDIKNVNFPLVTCDHS